MLDEKIFKKWVRTKIKAKKDISEDELVQAISENLGQDLFNRTSYEEKVYIYNTSETRAVLILKEMGYQTIYSLKK